MLEGAADGVHGDAPLGYELAGNAALFRGDFKLVRNLPPIGDGGWRLYDIRTDPGETRDLSTAMPDRLAAMPAAYRSFAPEHGVLDMPPGYTADQQLHLYAREHQGRHSALRRETRRETVCKSE